LLIAGLIILPSICLCSVVERLQPSPTPPPTATPVPSPTNTPEPEETTVLITVTEEQLTALIERTLANQEEAPPVRDPQVQLQDGQIAIYADVVLAEGASAPSTLILTPRVVDGEVELEVEEATVGPFPAPAETVDALVNYIETTVNAQLTSRVPEGTVTGIAVEDGEMTLYVEAPSE
jgi:uncharacterized protein YpmS